MEEWVGHQWHKFVMKKEPLHYPEAGVNLIDVKDQLQRLLVCFGESTLQICTAWPVDMPYPRFGLQKLVSTQAVDIAWRTQHELYLPESIAYFNSPSLNKDLYFWWMAIAVHWPSSGSWYQKNHIAFQKAKQHLPGLAKRWPAMLEAMLAKRPDRKLLSPEEAIHEQCIIDVLNDQFDEQIQKQRKLPLTRVYPFPVTLWLYPSPFIPDNAKPNLAEEDEEREANNEVNHVKGKKSARRVSEKDEKNGLLLFRLENLFTITDWLNIERPEEDDEDASNDAAQALDHITLSQSTSSKAAKVRFDLDLPSQDIDDIPLHEGILLPEWHYRKQGYLKDHCCLVPLLSREAIPCDVPDHLRSTVRVIRKQFMQWRSEPLALRRQYDGVDIDLQSWIDQKTEPTHDSVWPVYIAKPRIKAERTTLLLADVSQSTESYAHDRPVIDGIKDAMMVFSEGLNAIREPFSMYAFSSIRRRQVRFHMLKNANEEWNEVTRGRVQALKPGYYTRMGAAIRQSTEVLLDQKPQQKLMLLVTDGKPNDVDHYEHRYGIEDTKKAIQEARKKGIHVFTLTLDPEADEYAPELFGKDHFHRVTNNENLVDVLPRIFKQLTQ